MAQQYDPYDEEEQGLNAAEKRAMLLMMRGKNPTVTPQGVVLNGPDFLSGWQNAQGQGQLDRIGKQREDVRKRYQSDLDAILSKPDASPQDYMRHPATRQMGGELLKKSLAAKAFQEAVGGGQGGAGDEVAKLMKLAAGHPEETVRKWAENELKRFFPNEADPTKMYPQRGGPMAQMPGSNEAMYNRQYANELARANTTPVGPEYAAGPNGQGQLQPPRSQGSAMGLPQGMGQQMPQPQGQPGVPQQMPMQQGQQGVPQQMAMGQQPPVQPNPGVSGPVSAPGGLPPGGGAGAPPNNPSGFGGVVAGASSTAPGGAPTLGPRPSNAERAGGQLPSIKQGFMMAMLQGDTQTAAMYESTLLNMGVSPQEITQLTSQATAANQQRGGAPYSGAPQRTSALPQTGQLLSKEQVAERKGWGESLKTLKETGNTLKEMENLNKGKMSTGMATSWLNKGIAELASLTTKGYTGEGYAASNDRQFETMKNELALALVEKLKGQLSDKDRVFLENMNAQPSDSPAARAAIIQRLQRITGERITDLEGRLGIGRPTEPGANAAPGKQSALPNTYWNMTASASGGNDAARPGIGYNVQPGRDFQAPPNTALKDTLKDQLSLEGLNPFEILKGAGESWRNRFRGVGQVAEGVTGLDLGAPTEQEAQLLKQEQAEAAAKNLGRRRGQIFGSIFEPANFVPGQGIRSAVAAGTGSGLTEMAGSGQERAMNTIGGTAGGVVGGALGKGIGKTTSGDDQFFRRAPREMTEDELLAKKLGVQPTSAQLNPDSPFAKGLGVTAERDLRIKQIQNMTEGLLKETGSTAKTVSDKAINTRFDELSAGFDKLFPKNLYPKLDSTDKKALTDAIRRSPEVQDLMAKSSTLASIHNALQSTGPVKISAKDLHKAYREVGQVAGGGRSQAAGEVRNLLNGFIEKGLGSSNAKTFRTMNKQWGALEDLNRVWAQGSGQGMGRTAGLLRPSAIEEMGGKHPGDSMVGRASGVVRSMGMRDVGMAPEMPFGLGAAQAGRLAGHIPGAGHLSKTMFNADPATKFFLELLRGGARTAPREYGQTAGEQ